MRPFYILQILTILMFVGNAVHDIIVCNYKTWLLLSGNKKYESKKYFTPHKYVGIVLLILLSFYLPRLLGVK